jgi:hypothetical protein
MRKNGRRSACSLWIWLAATSGLLVFGSGRLAPLHLAAADAPAVEWVRYLDEAYTGCLKARLSTRTSEGGFVFWGGSGFDGVFMKVDSRGDLAWLKCRDRLQVLNAQLEDGGLLAIYIPSLGKFNRWGELEWESSLETILLGGSPVQLGDGSYMFFGNTQADVPVGFMQRISAAGAIDSPTIIPDRFFWSILRTSDGGAFVLGQDPWIEPTEETVLRFLKLDSTGETEWEKSLTIASRSVLSHATAFQLKSGDYAFGYSTGDEQSVLLYFYVQLDALGNVISHEQYDPSSVIAPLGSGIELANGDRVQVVTRSTGAVSRGYLALVSSGWETRWIVEVSKESALDVQLTPDGGYLVHAYDGQREDGTTGPAKLVKLGPDTGNPSRLFIRGDANGDGALDIADPVATLGFLFLGDAVPGCLEAANTNDDGEVDISDAVHTLTTFSWAASRSRRLSRGG